MCKKYQIYLPICLLGLSGCSWRGKKKEACPGYSEQEQVASSEENRTSLFDEQENAFVLTENNDPFSPESPSLKLVDEGTLWAAEQRGEFPTVYFEFDRYKVTPEHRTVLKRVAKTIREMIDRGELGTDGIVMVEGHACNSAGDERYNLMLSEKRAREVLSFLVSEGVSADRLRVVGRGFSMRKVPSGSREQQAPNRRVEFYVVRDVSKKS